MKFSKNVIILSFVSLLNDVAGETVRRLIPLFLSTVLGVQTSIIGLIEGVGEATPHIFEPISGYISDKTEKRKIFVVFGQILRASMILFIFVTSWPQALLIRFLDRTGKGIALAPRDSLIAASTKDGHQGRSFGLNRAMDNLGATMGIILIIATILLIHNPEFLNRSVFQFLIIIIAAPALFVALLLLMFMVRDKKDGEKGFEFHDHLGKDYYIFLVLSFLFSIGNFSDGFLVLRASELGLSLVSIFALLAVFTLSSTLISLPAGNYSDHHQRKLVLVLGWLIFSGSYIGFGMATSLWQLLPLFIIYGLYYGITQGVAKAMISDLVPQAKRGLAFGLYSMILGLGLLPASVLAGYLWQRFDPSITFYTGSSFAVIAALGLLFFLPKPKQKWWQVWDK
ncbi:MFS transporter [Candidatus Gottesmanbacteria bacterium]|nr:MFS transporter [Candidatus Gottesmanbacteria bacterium]